MPEPLDVVEASLSDLERITSRAKVDGDLQLFQHAFLAWKDRTTKNLAQFVSARTLRRFQYLHTRPSWINMEDPGDPAAEHQACLLAIAEEMQAHPEEFGAQAARETETEERERARPVSRADPLILPEKVTLAWLWGHVPIHLWIAFIGLLIAAFLTGVRLATSSGLGLILKSLVGAS